MTEYIELTTVGEMLKSEFIEPFNLTQNALANAIFVPPNRIHQIVKGQRRITADTDLRLTTYFGLSQGYFLRYQEDYELRVARREISDDIAKITKFVSRYIHTYVRWLIALMFSKVFRSNLFVIRTHALSRCKQVRVFG